ncbi:peroxiredoxin-like family protein [Roseibacillus ishigakijimensis]|uniref:AhpC/TSA family protein n=1 Tax=Roseibacillus ishigakijimensis TaxID=454146 RepID=A0A934RPK2_9BACT|nr:peroxiredoxin-like family protein [Roseibacillus ishigakijimensis]MBK1834608.1 AhpC/TSA family protein [Roseibacillus ishigakijimensis]
MSKKLTSGGTLPAITLPLAGGGEATLGQTRSEDVWQIVIIYRGLHCPICHKYLARLEELREDFAKASAEILAVSGDPWEKARTMVEEHDLKFPVAYDLSIAQMQQLGLYISEPRGPQETDRPFAEPATFALNREGKIQLIELSNTPFNRADLSELLESVEWIDENDYPIRGTHP